MQFWMRLSPFRLSKPPADQHMVHEYNNNKGGFPGFFQNMLLQDTVPQKSVKNAGHGAGFVSYAFPELTRPITLDRAKTEFIPCIFVDQYQFGLIHIAIYLPPLGCRRPLPTVLRNSPHPEPTLAPCSGNEPRPKRRPPNGASGLSPSNPCSSSWPCFWRCGSIIGTPSGTTRSWWSRSWKAHARRSTKTWRSSPGRWSTADSSSTKSDPAGCTAMNYEKCKLV